MQVITYKEFLPALLGRNPLRSYRGYNDEVEAGIANVFSTAAFRVGHTMLSAQILRLDAEGNDIAAGPLPLRNAFFSSTRLLQAHGIEPLLRGLAHQVCEKVDAYVVEEVQNFLFGQPGQGGFDLAALNIQRGRDHGLPSYNDAREAMGLRRVRNFAGISSDPEIQSRLAAAYGDVDLVDMWVGGISEDHFRGAQVGRLFFTILKQQFEALRDGDRFWYEAHLSRDELREVNNTRLSDIIRRNTDIGDEIPDNVFYVGGRRARR